MFNDTKKAIYSQGILLSIFFFFAGASSIEAASPRRTIKEGNLFYKQGDYISSEEKFREAFEKDPESDIVNFNLGTALYKKEQYQGAMDHFQKAFLSEDDQLRHKAYYNSGNALYKMGIAEEREGGAALAVPPVEQSLKQYERALEIDESDEDTKHNYAFVQKELKRLKEIQKQEQQQGDQGEDPEQSEGQQQQGQGQDQQSKSNQSQEGREDQRQQKGDEREGQQEQQDLDQGQKDGEEDNKQQNTGTQPQSASELTSQEALMLLEKYQQTEEPQQPLNMQPKVNNPSPVLNDW